MLEFAEETREAVYSCPGELFDRWGSIGGMSGGENI